MYRPNLAVTEGKPHATLCYRRVSVCLYERSRYRIKMTGRIELVLAFLQPQIHVSYAVIMKFGHLVENFATRQVDRFVNKPRRRTTRPSVKCVNFVEFNALTRVLRFVVDLLCNSFLYCLAAVNNTLTDIARRAARLRYSSASL